MTTLAHKAGFVNIVGKPNVGKSTLMNVLVGERLSITTAKVQTTRHRITGVVNGNNFQIVYTDTPGIITPNYTLQQSMMRKVHSALVDADVLLWVVDVRDQDFSMHFKKKLLPQHIPIFLLINKIDLIDRPALKKALRAWYTHVAVQAIIPIVALKAYNMERVFTNILSYLPEHPPYYPRDMLTDKPERFFVAEIIREKILYSFRQEIPYSVEVVVETFQDKRNCITIRAVINADKQSQKSILIGKKGEALKRVGIAARKDLEQLFGKKVFLEQYVKIVPGWRNKPNHLHRFGYT